MGEGCLRAPSFAVSFPLTLTRRFDGLRSPQINGASADPASVCGRFSRSGSQNAERNDWGGFRFQQKGNRSNVSQAAASAAKVQRLSLALAVTAVPLGCGTVPRAQPSTVVYPAGLTVCQPLPSWYPRGWELMVRRPCATYVYGPSYYPATYYSYPAVYPYQRVSTRAVHPV